MIYFLKLISDDIRGAQEEFRKHSRLKKLALGSLLACVAAVFQAAGGFLPGVGYLISPFATLPILIGAMFSLQMGMMSYFLSILLLFMLFPSELVIFPFTTGLLGIGIGTALSLFKKRLSIIVSGALFLTAGIMSLLYVFRFPILGPVVSDSYSFLTMAIIYIFSFFYSWLWVEMALFFFKKLKTSF